MTQKAVESLLGRLLTDHGFRRRFYEEPATSCRQEALDVTSRELEAVLVVGESLFEEFAHRLDPRIVRAAVGRHARSRTKSAAELGSTKVGLK